MATKPKRVKVLQSLYLEPDRTALVNELSRKTRVLKSRLLREAVDDLLVKYKMLTPTKRIARKGRSTL